MEDETPCEELLLNRYSRQMLIPHVGIEGQLALSSASVVVIGAGGIGSTVLLYLAGAGIGRIEVVDFDKVELTNLHRQVIHDTDSVGKFKTTSAIDRLRKQNDSITITESRVRLGVENAIDVLRPFDLVVDATDNFNARYLINDACVLLGKPLVSGSAVGLEGQISILSTPSGPCYRCIYPEPSLAESCRSCANAGVLGPIPGLIGCLQSVECIKLLLTLKSSTSSTKLKPLIGRQVFYDGLSGEFYTFALPARDSSCAVCGSNPTIKSMADSAVDTERAMAESISKLPDRELPPSARVAAADYHASVISHRVSHVLLDCRSEVQFKMTSFRRYYKNGSFEFERLSMRATDSPRVNQKAPQDGTDVASDSKQHADETAADFLQLVNLPLSQLTGGRPASSEPGADKGDLPGLSRLRALRKPTAASTASMASTASVASMAPFQKPVAIDGTSFASSSSPSIDSTHEGSLGSQEQQQGLHEEQGGQQQQQQLRRHQPEAGQERQKGHEGQEGQEEQRWEAAIGDVADVCSKELPIYVICRRGIDSVTTTKFLLDHGFTSVYNIEGGLADWRRDCDPSFPSY